MCKGITSIDQALRLNEIDLNSVYKNHLIEQSAGLVML